MLTISSDYIIEKNKITSDGTWLLLLDITYPGEDTIYVCLNGETITWNSNDYLPAIFSLSGITETKDAEVPSIPLTIFDLNRTLIPILKEYDGAIGAEVTIRVVHSDYLAVSTPALEEVAEIIDCQIDYQGKITFKLGAENLSDRRCPQQRYLKNNCRFVFKRAELDFTSGGVTELTVGDYIKGDISGDTASVVDIRLSSGSWTGGDAAGKIVIDTILGGFEAETISAYSDSGFITLIQSNIFSIGAGSKGRCNYIGSDTTCGRSLADCVEKNNDINFGGFPGVGSIGYIA